MVVARKTENEGMLPEIIKILTTNILGYRYLAQTPTYLCLHHLGASEGHRKGVNNTREKGRVLGRFYCITVNSLLYN